MDRLDWLYSFGALQARVKEIARHLEGAENAECEGARLYHRDMAHRMIEDAACYEGEAYPHKAVAA